MGIISKIFGRRPVRAVVKPGDYIPGRSVRTVPRAELPTGRRTYLPHPTSGDDVSEFLNGAMVERLSSVVARAQYDSERQILYIWYLAGEVWAYDPYTEAEAEDFLRAPSAGGWLADHVRDYSVSIHAHQRNARQVG